MTRKIADLLEGPELNIQKLNLKTHSPLAVATSVDLAPVWKESQKQKTWFETHKG